ncbi:MAG: hypothetical protein COA85_07950 [Robiginitomaculum sp.]|nr:MAG: hypothetical protein COA85_07950 [Robiginitomaculum sp.]
MSEKETSPLPPDPRLRRCHACGQPNMATTTRQMSRFNTDNTYKCPDCGHEVTLASQGASGFYLAMGLIVVGVLALIMGISHGFSTGEKIFTGIVLMVFTFVPVLEIIQRLHYPVTGTRKDGDQPPAAASVRPKDPLQRSLALLNAFGFFKAFFGVIAFIILWLLFWSVIGFINFTFF